MYMRGTARIVHDPATKPGTIRVQDCLIPPGLTTLDEFREWAHSDSYPERGDFTWMDGQLWVDLDMETAETHGLVKTAFAGVLYALVSSRELGVLFIDTMRFTQPAFDLSSEPDVMFISNESLADGTVRPVPGASGNAVEFEGAPDVIVEVVSDSSQLKDVVLFPQKLHQAGVKEYWIVDVRRGALSFRILRRGAKKFIETPSRSGWVVSRVFRRSFSLTRKDSKALGVDYILKHRPLPKTKR